MCEKSFQINDLAKHMNEAHEAGYKLCTHCQIRIPGSLNLLYSPLALYNACPGSPK